MARKKVIPGDVRWPAWYYSPNGERGIFQTEADVPLGWTEKPVISPELGVGGDHVHESCEELIAELEHHGVDIQHYWGLTQLKRVLDDFRSTR